MLFREIFGVVSTKMAFMSGSDAKVQVIVKEINCQNFLGRPLAYDQIENKIAQSGTVASCLSCILKDICL